VWYSFCVGTAGCVAYITIVRSHHAQGQEFGALFRALLEKGIVAVALYRAATPHHTGYVYTGMVITTPAVAVTVVD